MGNHHNFSKTKFRKFQDFTSPDGTVQYGKLFTSLQDQDFRKEWIHKAINFAVDWVIYITDPEVYGE
jgi:hypothetical protein